MQEKININTSATRLHDASLSHELVTSSHTDSFFNGELMTGFVTNFFPSPCGREDILMDNSNNNNISNNNYHCHHHHNHYHYYIITYYYMAASHKDWELANFN